MEFDCGDKKTANFYDAKRKKNLLAEMHSDLSSGIGMATNHPLGTESSLLNVVMSHN